jgi:hypothetical protein
MLDLDAAGTIGDGNDLTVHDQLQTLQLIEVGVDVGLRMQQQGLAQLDLGSPAHRGRANVKRKHRPIRDEGSASPDRIAPCVGGERSVDPREEPDGASRIDVGVIRASDRGKAEPKIEKVIPRLDAESIRLKHLHHIHNAEWHVQCEPDALAEPVAADVRVAAHRAASPESFEQLVVQEVALHVARAFSDIEMNSVTPAARTRVLLTAHQVVTVPTNPTI